MLKATFEFGEGEEAEYWVVIHNIITYGFVDLATYELN